MILRFYLFSGGGIKVIIIAVRAHIKLIAYDSGKIIFKYACFDIPFSEFGYDPRMLFAVVIIKNQNSSHCVKHRIIGAIGRKQTILSR